MEPTPKQQAVELINRANNILVVPGGPVDGDAVGSALALLMVLEKLNKKISLASQELTTPTYRFLPRADETGKTVDGARDFIVTLDSPSVEMDKLSYNLDGGKLNIIITPGKGQYKPEDVKFSQGEPKYDLVITLDTPYPSQLGKIYEQHTALFQELPVINIDHHASNSYFGTVNLVDLTATSTAEILIGLIEALGTDLIDADVATCLLTGIISDTGSFQNANTTPKSLTVAAQLVGFGARQQEIIRCLFKTKSLSTLKLWGQILSNIQLDLDHKFVWAVATLKDLQDSGAGENDFSGLIDELMTSVPGADVVLLLSERQPRKIYGSVRTVKGVDAKEIVELFGGGGHVGAAAFQMSDMGIDEASPIVLEKIREYQAKRLGLQAAPVPEGVSPDAQNPSNAAP